MARATTASIHIDTLRHNLGVIRARAPMASVMAVVKADGYGHGLERVAQALVGADAFGVAALSDARRLRAAGLSQKILLLSGFDEPADLAQLRQLDVDTVVHHASQLDMLAHDRGSPIKVWLKMDSGMHRLGFPPQAYAEAHARLRSMPNVASDIVCMSHLASSEDLSSTQTPAQCACFDSHVPGGAPVSLANSAGILLWPQTHRQWLRAGGALYGLSVAAGKSGADFGLKPAMTLGTRLISVQTVAAGERVGYSGTYTCPESMPVGVAAIGYGDGYPRNIRSGTPVLLNGRRVPVIGRVSMDLMTLDLRSQPTAAVGDPVVLWGEGLPVEEIAEAAGTISYELTCSITRRVRFVES